MISDARILIDRRSRRVAQNVVSVWANFVREKRGLKARTLCAQRVFAGRALATVFRRWASVTRTLACSRVEAEDRLIRAQRATLRNTFQQWVVETKTTFKLDLMSHALTRRDRQAVLTRCFYTWREVTLLELEAEHGFSQLENVFRLNVLRRLFVAWTTAFRRERRLEQVKVIYIGIRSRMLKHTALSTWRGAIRAFKQGSSDTPFGSDSKTAQPEPGQESRLIANMMKRIEHQDAKMETLARELNKKRESGAQNGTFSIEQLSSDDEEESVTYNQTHPASMKEPRYGRRSLPPVSPSSSNGMNVFRSSRSPAGDRPLSFPSTPTSRRASSGNGYGHSYEHGSSETRELILDTPGIQGMYEDGTMVLEQTQFVMDMSTLYQAAKEVSLPPLFFATRLNVLENVRMLLEQGANPNEVCGSHQRTILHEAIDSNTCVKIIELLLERGADVEGRNADGNTPLMAAALKGDEAAPITKLLLRHGAKESTNQHGQTPLHAAARTGAIQTMHLLLDQNASLSQDDAQGQTALHHACRSGNPKLIESIIGYITMRSPGKLKNMQDSYGNTALHIVCDDGGKDMEREIVVLLEHDFDPNIRNQAGQTPIHLLAQNSETTKSLLSRLKNYPVRFHEQDKTGQTALHIAVFLNHQTVALGLVRCGAELFAVDKDGQTPLNLATKDFEMKLLSAICSPPLNLATKDFGIKLLSAICSPPDLVLAKRLQADVSTCMICSASFHMFSTRKYCHHCGRLVCAECSKRHFPIHKFDRGDKPERVCDHCVPVLTPPHGGIESTVAGGADVNRLHPDMEDSDSQVSLITTE